MLCWWPRSILTENPVNVPISNINKLKPVWEKSKLPKDHNYGFKASKDRKEIIDTGICCQKTFEKCKNNNEIKVCLMRRRTRGRLCGKKTGSHFSWRFLFCPGKWDVFLPYVHLPQLTAHIRKGLLKRRNNEKERDWELCGTPLFSPFGRNILSAGTKRSSLPALIPSGLVWKWQKSMQKSKWSWPGRRGRRDLEDVNQWREVDFKFSERKDATDSFSCRALIF